ncbi:MAG: hypothetical protein K2W82_17530 [Candidatus Obscuribacterales bacterium]|nr:hypothetical protein [Candidatus Obscuribacterales bacterium]
MQTFLAALSAAFCAAILAVVVMIGSGTPFSWAFLLYVVAITGGIACLSAGFVWLLGCKLTDLGVYATTSSVIYVLFALAGLLYYDPGLGVLDTVRALLTTALIGFCLGMTASATAGIHKLLRPRRR